MILVLCCDRGRRNCEEFHQRQIKVVGKPRKVKEKKGKHFEFHLHARMWRISPISPLVHEYWHADPRILRLSVATKSLWFAIRQAASLDLHDLRHGSHDV
jgi:hypothetical protein